jgi:hypothetical protein
MSMSGPLSEGAPAGESPLADHPGLGDSPAQTVTA